MAEHESRECRRSARRVVQTCSSSSHTSSAPPLTPAERAKRYRESFKKNPKKLREYLQKERERKQLRWKNRTEEQIIDDRRKARERQQRFRDKKKMMGIKIVGSNEKKKVLTRSEREKKREYWREKQAESRARRSSQKHRRIKEKDRNYHQVKRTSQSKVVKRSRQKGCLPADPEKFVDALEDIIDKATPRRKALVKDKQLLNTPKSRKKLMFFEKSSQVLKKVIKRNSMVKKRFHWKPIISEEVQTKQNTGNLLGRK